MWTLCREGQFSVDLGSTDNPFPDGLWSREVFIGLMIGGEELQPRRRLTAHAYAFKAEDADTLVGASRVDLDQRGDVDALGGELDQVTADIDNLESGVNQVETRLSAVENIGADITAVVPGQGLVGGATAGPATISIGNGGVTQAMIANSAVRASAIAADAVGTSELADGAVTAENIAVGAVTTVAIADGSITPADIDAGGAFAMQGLSVGSLSAESVVVGYRTEIEFFQTTQIVPSCPAFGGASCFAGERQFSCNAGETLVNAQVGLTNLTRPMGNIRPEASFDQQVYSCQAISTLAEDVICRYTCGRIR